VQQLDINSLREYGEALRRRMGDLEAQISPLTQALAEARIQLQALETLLSASDPDYAKLRNASVHGRTGRAAEWGVADAAYDTLAAVRQPMHYRDLYATMVDRGAKVRGKDPAANVIAHINVDPRFIRVSRGTYALKEWDDNA